MDKFEQLIRDLTTEINGQYPRPWMTDLENPSCADVFIVGYNPATAYPSNDVSYERFIDSLFNRNGETCRKFYAEITKQTPTRSNIEMLVDKLTKIGVSSILETNVVCYGAKKKKYLRRREHVGGKARGMEIFRKLVEVIRPKVILIHGNGVCKTFRYSFNLSLLPDAPEAKNMFVQVKLDWGTELFVIPSLALPAFRNWPKSPLESFCNWADEYLDEVSKRILTVIEPDARQC